MGLIENLRGEHLIEKFTYIENGTLKIKEDELVESYIFTSKPIIFAIAGLYLLIALKGPKLMQNRRPFNLRKTMIIYNAFQIISCSLYLYVTFMSLSPKDVVTYLFSNVCRPVGQPYDSKMRIYALQGTYVYLIMKITDLPDTLFMVLRKKFAHITFLHLFHHTTMVLSMWYHLVYVRGELGACFGLLNIFVHIIMYSYYLISALGPRYRAIVAPYKQYVTLLQISQFAVILSIMGILIWNGCEMPPNLKSMWLFNNLLFFVLFINFYVRTFLLKKDKKQ